MRHTYPAPEPMDLDVKVHAGDLRITAGPVTEVVIDGMTGRGDSAPELEVSADASRITVREPRQSATLLGLRRKIDIEIQVPERSTLNASSGSGDIVLTGRFGRLEVTTGSGDVLVDQIAEQSTLTSGSGDVNVGRVLAPLTLRAASGDATVTEIWAPSRLKVGSGDAVVRSVHADLQATSGSGDVRLDAVHAGELDLRTGSGDATIGVPQAVAVWADVQATTGSVTNRLTSRGMPAEGQARVSIRALLGTGSAVLRDA